MYEFLRGTLTQRKLARAVLDVNGIGFDLTTPLSTHDQLPAPGSVVTLLIHYHQREDGPRLYAFATRAERELFRTLIGISGIGPATAIQILSAVQIPKFLEAVSAGDEKALTRIKGIGKKTAQRLIVELSGRLPVLDEAVVLREDGTTPASGPAFAIDARRALETLGVDPSRAEQIVAQVIASLGRPPESADELVRLAIRMA